MSSWIRNTVASQIFQLFFIMVQPWLHATYRKSQSIIFSFSAPSLRCSRGILVRFFFVVFKARDTDTRKLNRGNALKQTPAAQARAHLNFQFKV